MNDSSPHARTWWTHLVAVIVVATLSVTLWRPSIEMAAYTADEDRIVAEFATLLGSSNADGIEARLRSFSHFPPEENAGRALADGLIGCRAASLDDTERRRLAQQLYAITTATDGLSSLLPGALSAIQQSMIAAKCPPLAIEAAVRSARQVARRDPSPRRDWW
ncbi:MAG TPA: hypothetical protein VI485_29210 [Vicinamibacterales bacterium]|nr:hypothetical protein [Vicinamibacterales bacterium]